MTKEEFINKYKTDAYVVTDKGSYVILSSKGGICFVFDADKNNCFRVECPDPQDLWWDDIQYLISCYLDDDIIVTALVDFWRSEDAFLPLPEMYAKLLNHNEDYNHRCYWTPLSVYSSELVDAIEDDYYDIIHPDEVTNRADILCNLVTEYVVKYGEEGKYNKKMLYSVLTKFVDFIIDNYSNNYWDFEESTQIVTKLYNELKKIKGIQDVPFGKSDLPNKLQINL